MNKKEIIDELHKMGYEVKEETLVKNGVNVFVISQNVHDMIILASKD